jgi:hypothetical protein
MRSKQQLLFSPAGEVAEGWLPVLAHIRANDVIAPIPDLPAPSPE